jgi:hypothetical protein
LHIPSIVYQSMEEIGFFIPPFELYNDSDGNDILSLIQQDKKHGKKVGVKWGE